MVALGCKYLRICHLNNCATGVATQHNVLREKYFIGMPDMVINYFRFVAREVRETLAALGVRTMAELIGQTQYLQPALGQTPRQSRLDLSPLLSIAGCQPAVRSSASRRPTRHSTKACSREDGGRHVCRHPEWQRRRVALRGEELQPLDRCAHLGRNRAALGQLRHGECTGDGEAHRLGGQSFGVWNAGGLHMILEGDANDYVGKA